MRGALLIVAALGAALALASASLASGGPTGCAPGAYFDGTSCVPAPPGYFSLGAAATTPTPCAQGYFQPLAGASSCLPARAGYFVPASGAKDETACAPG